VEYWNNTRWVLKGAGPLNANASANTTATSVSLATDGGTIYAAWTEYTTQYTSQIQDSPAQVYVARWDSGSSTWVIIGNGINVSSQNVADGVAIECLNGQPYVAWTERSAAGNTQVYVKTYNGSGWSLVGSGSMNKDTNTGWAYKPSLAADAASGAVYLGWTEQQALGQRVQAYVSRYSGGLWTALGGTLNANPTLGSSQRITLAVMGGQPIAAWAEVNLGATRQIFVNQWSGSTWIPLNGGSTSPSPQPASVPPSQPASACDVNGDGAVNASDVQLAINQALGLTPCGSADLQHSGKCTVVDVQRIINASLGGACIVGQ